MLLVWCLNQTHTRIEGHGICVCVKGGKHYQKLKTQQQTQTEKHKTKWMGVLWYNSKNKTSNTNNNRTNNNNIHTKQQLFVKYTPIQNRSKQKTSRYELNK